MARRINQDDIKQINELYLKYGTYSKVAAELGFAATTVKKYIVPNYVSETDIKAKQKPFNMELLNTKFDYHPFLIENWGELCVLSVSEEDELKKFWEEMTL
jgi:alpha-D-ribose 1-methylphosphonate 5-phosphate C-P lyase